MHLRATWKGSLNVSLVSLRVKAYTSAAAEQEAVHLHQLHASCQSRIRYHKVCPQHGPVPNDQIVMGYEHAPHQHVVIDLAELDRLRSQQQLRAIRIDTFVEAADTSSWPALTPQRAMKTRGTNSMALRWNMVLRASLFSAPKRERSVSRCASTRIPNTVRPREPVTARRRNSGSGCGLWGGEGGASKPHKSPPVVARTRVM